MKLNLLYLFLVLILSISLFQSSKSQESRLKDFENQKEKFLNGITASKLNNYMKIMKMKVN
jgi:hypothetical protein